jgi:hypothetical protein
MNLLILDQDPVQAAVALCDQHLNTKIKETSLIIATAWYRNSIHSGMRVLPEYSWNKTGDNTVKWVAETVPNYSWACTYGLALLTEYNSRFKKQHKKYEDIHWLCENPPAFLWVPQMDGPAFTNFPVFQRIVINSAPDPDVRSPFVIKVPTALRSDDPVFSYRLYYSVAMERTAKWTRGTPPPSWWKAI